MKKLAILLLAVFSLLIVSCAQSVPDKMVKLADQAASKGEKWSQDKWEQVAEEFGQLLEEYEANEDSYGAFKISSYNFRFDTKSTRQSNDGCFFLRIFSMRNA